MAYGTIAFNGEAIVKSLLEAGYRVIFRRILEPES